MKPNNDALIPGESITYTKWWQRALLWFKRAHVVVSVDPAILGTGGMFKCYYKRLNGKLHFLKSEEIKP